MENFIVSARKYRPAAFEAVVGQKTLTETLQNAIASNHLASAYLFCGPRGVGKTTCARIFAKSINAISKEDDLDQYAFNIHELDAASNNSVDDIRNLIKEVMIPPQVGKYSVFIIDEVHMLSGGAFNALLKTLEEPPSYAIFILATTEKHKVLPTILSRCQVYDFQRISVSDIIGHLAYVAREQGVNIGEDSLNVIAQKADGGMRDALSIFDQLVSFAGTDISYERTIAVLNVLDTDYYFRLTEMALQGQIQQALLLLNEVLSKGFDQQQFIVGFMQHLRDVLVSKDAQTIQLLETSEGIRAQYAEQGKQCAATWLIQALELMNTCDVQYRTSKNKRLTVELALIKLCRLLTTEASRPQASAPVQNPVAKPAPVQVQAQPAASRPAAPVQSVATQPVARPTAPPPSAPASMPMGMPQMPSISLKGTTAVPQPAAPTASVNASSPIGSNPFSDDQLQDAWAGLMALYMSEARLKVLISEHSPVRKEGSKLSLTLVNTYQRDLYKKHSREILDHLRQTLNNRDIEIEIEIKEQEATHIAYTAEEKYKVLLDENELLSVLKDTLHLQLE